MKHKPWSDASECKCSPDEGGEWVVGRRAAHGKEWYRQVAASHKPSTRIQNHRICAAQKRRDIRKGISNGRGRGRGRGGSRDKEMEEDRGTGTDTQTNMKTTQGVGSTHRRVSFAKQPYFCRVLFQKKPIHMLQEIYLKFKPTNRCQGKQGTNELRS